MSKTANIFRSVIRLKLISGIIFIMLGINLYAQTTYPVQVITQLTPPYTPYLPAYYSGINQKLKVTLINTDMKQPLLSVYLRMAIKSSAFTIETPENVFTERIELQAGVPLQLSLNDLTPYFKNENMRISGGRNEFLRTNMLPDNFYRFNFEVYEANTGRLLSNPKLGFAQAMIASGEPPVLNMPLKGTTIMESNIPSIMFSWTPRHMNSVASAYGTEYEFTLVEIYDKQIAPEAAFDFSRVLYTETVRSTSFIHTVAQPVLIPGMRYAWRVRAVAREGVEEANVFKNNGFSPISWFDYTVECKQVRFDKVEVTDRVAIISWQQSDAIDYDVQYRKKGSNKWYTGSLKDNETCPVYNLKFGEEYEYRIGVRCTMNDAFTYTEAKGFSMPEELAKSANCGILPNINVSNQTPARELQAKLPVLVGDFPVFITKVSGSGRFTGEGYIGIPYLKNAKIAVIFKDIVVNTDNRMIAGFIETKYDISSGKNLLWDVDETLTGGKGVGDIRTGEEKAQYIVDYTIDSKLTQVPVKKDTSKDEIREGETSETASGENESYIVTLTDDKGNKQEQVVDKFPATIEDKSGAIYEVDKEGNIRQVSSKSDIKLDDNTKYKQDTTVVAVRFEKTDNTRYALDVYTDIYSKVTEYEREYIVSETEPIRASAKLMLPGTSDEIFVKAIPQPEKDSQQKFDPTKVHFVTESQTEYKAEYDSQKGGWTLNLVAPPANDGQLVYVVYDKGNGQYGTLAILKVLTYEPKEVNVMLVPVNKKEGTHGIDEAAIEREVNAIYNNFGVMVNIKVSDKEFEYTPLDGSTFQVDGTGLFETRTADMKTLEDTFMATGEYNDQTVYLFVMDKPSNVPDAKGDMPRDSRMGYLFPSYDAHTIAHEIGHGVFNLKHPFAKGILTNQFNEGELKDNLMDYPIGNGLAKLQWDALHAPGIVIGIFEKDKDAMFAGGFVFTPDYKLTHINGTSTVIIDPANRESLKIGTLPGFEIVENGITNRYVWKNGAYVLFDFDRQAYQPATVYEIPVQNSLKDKESTIYLFYNLENACGGQAYIQATYTGELATLVDNINKNNIQDKTEAFVKVIESLKGKSSLLPCRGTKDDINESAWRVSNIPVNCGAADIRQSLSAQLDNVSKITAGTSSENVFNILKTNYSPCLINLLDIEKRILIINKIIDNDDYWKIDDTDILSELILTTPQQDRVKLLRDGIQAGKYHWLEAIYDDGNSAMIHNLFLTLNEWVIENYADLGIQPTSRTGTTQLYENGQWVQKTVKYFPGSEPYYIGLRADNPLTSGNYTIVGYPRNFEVEFREGSVYFIQSYYYQDNRTHITSYEADSPNAILNVSTEYTLNPFEPVNIIIGKNYGSLNLTAGNLHTSTAFLAMLLYKDVKDEIVETEIRKVVDGVAIGAGVLAAIPSGGTSLEAAVSIVAMVNGLASVYDLIQLDARDNLTPAEYNENREFYEAWDNFKAVLDIADLAAGLTYGVQAVANSPKVIRYWNNLMDCGAKQSGKLSGKAADLWKILRAGDAAADVTKDFTRAKTLIREVIGDATKFADDSKTLERLSEMMIENSNFRKAFSSAWEDELKKIIKANSDLRCATCGNAAAYNTRLPSMDEMLENVEHFSQFKNVDGFDYTFNQFSSGNINFRDGLNHMASYMKKHPDEFSNISGFEFRYNDDILRRADARVGEHTLYEFKSWSPDNVNVWGNFFNGKGNSYEQFLEYLRDPELGSLNNLHYVFNGQKADITQVKNAFKELFTNKTDEIFEVIWNNQGLKNSLFGTDISKADAVLDFADYVKNIDGRLYKFIESE